MHWLALVIAYLAFRLALHVALPDLWRHFAAFVELCTPLSSYRSTLEGLYLLLTAHVNPYSGSVFRQSPLLLALFSSIPDSCRSLVFPIADAFGAASVAQIASVVNAKNIAGSKGFIVSPSVAAACYLLNPFSLLGSLAQSTNVVSNALVCMALVSAYTQRPLRATFCYSLSCVVAFYPLYLVLAFFLILKQNCGEKPLRFVYRFLVCTGGLLMLSFFTAGSWVFVREQYVAIATMQDLTRPNIGLWWYFFVEIFDSFRHFYVCIFQLFLVSLQVPLAIRLPNRPLCVVAILSGFLAAFKPYPESSDLGLFLTLLVLNARESRLLSHTRLIGFALVHWALLSPSFYYLWIYSGAGNSNFFYATNLVYASIVTLSLADMSWAVIRDEYDGGKDPELTQI